MPIIVVFTKLDLFLAKLERRGEIKGRGNLEGAEGIFREKYNKIFEKSTKNMGGHIPYALVTTSTFAPAIILFALTSLCSISS